MAVRITGINKDNGDHENPHDAVTNYCWLNEQDNSSGKTARPEMVAWVNGGGLAYVKDSRGSVNCYVNVSRAGTKFLQTRSDNRWTDNLLSLPEC